MLFSLHVKCPLCESMYTLSIKELNVIVLFRCNECDQHNMYVCGQVIMLDTDIMVQGTDIEKRCHVLEILQLWARDFADNVSRNVNRVIDVNVDAGLRNSGSWESTPVEKKAEAARERPASRRHPTVLWMDAPKITDEEVHDFISIDLNLIDRNRYFNRFFGGHDS